MNTRGMKHRTRWGLVAMSLAGLVTVCGWDRPAEAAVGILKIKTGFNSDAGEVYTPYILASDYSLRRTWGGDCSTGWETILTGLSSQAIDLAVMDSNDICVLWSYGGKAEVWCWDEWVSGWHYYPEPSGMGFIKIASGGGGRLFARTSSGDIYRYCQGDLWCDQGWSLYSSGAQAVELATKQWDGDQVFFLAPPSAGSSYTAKSVSTPGGAITSYGGPRGSKIAVGDDGRPWATSGSSIYRWDGSRWRSTWTAGAVYEMDIDQVHQDLLILSSPSVGSGYTLWSHDLYGGGWYRCPNPG